MPFGPTNAYAAFMDLMNRVFKLYSNMFVVVFIDEILVNSQNKEEHANQLRIALQTLTERQLFAKFSKYEIWQRSVAFLCHIVSSEDIMIDPKKTKGINNWPRPFSPSNIQSFLDLACYNRRFVEGFLFIATFIVTPEKF